MSPSWVCACDGNIVGSRQLSFFQIAGDVHGAMTADLDLGKIADGLHSAVRRLKDEASTDEWGFCRHLRDEPLLWASSVHVRA